MRCGASSVIRAAEVITQQVPAAASNRPNTTSRRSSDRQTATTVGQPAASPRSSARLTA